MAQAVGEFAEVSPIWTASFSKPGWDDCRMLGDIIKALVLRSREWPGSRSLAGFDNHLEIGLVQ